MKIEDAVKILDECIPDPDNAMVDMEHIDIAIAWKEIKKELESRIE